MDTLACLKSMDGKYEEAIKIEKEALKLMENGRNKLTMEQNIKNWEKKLKN